MQELLNLEISHFVWYAITILVASYVRGFSGFGFTSIFLTALAFILPVAEIVPISIALELTASSAQARGILHHVKWPELGALLITGIVCTPIGVFFLGYVDDQSLRVMALLFVFLASVYLAFWRGHVLTYSRVTYALAGCVIGIVNGATALSGLVLALFFSLSDERAEKMRATMIGYLFAADIWAFALLLGAGYYDSAAITRTIISLPLLWFGVRLGSRHFASAPPETYRKVVLRLLLALSAAGLIAIVAGPAP